MMLFTLGALMMSAGSVQPAATDLDALTAVPVQERGQERPQTGQRGNTPQREKAGQGNTPRVQGGTPPQRGGQQRGGDAQRGGEQRGGEQRGGEQRGGEQRGDDAKRGDQQRGGDAQRGGQNGEGARGMRGNMTDAQVLAKMAKEEKKHRERVAKLERLKQLATESDNRARLAEVEKLISQEDRRYNRVLELGREAVGADRFNRLRNRMMERAKGQQGGDDAGQRGGEQRGGEQRGGEQRGGEQRGNDQQRGGDSGQRGSDQQRGGDAGQRGGTQRGGGR